METILTLSIDFFTIVLFLFVILSLLSLFIPNKLSFWTAEQLGRFRVFGTYLVFIFSTGVSIIGLSVLSCLFSNHMNLTTTANTDETKQVDVKYELIEDKRYDNFDKRSVVVRLDEKVSKEQLIQIGTDIKNETSFSKTFINYYLPEMVVGDGSWAYTHFRPELDVRIQGLKKGGLNDLKIYNNESVIGKWEDKAFGIIYVLEKNGDSYVMTLNLSDGKVIQEVKRVSENKFIQVDPEKEDYYIINDGGNLEVWDDIGKVDTLVKF